MKAIIVADAHIKGLDDPNQKNLCQFLDFPDAALPDKVIILGDLFDLWTGFNDVTCRHYSPTLAVFSKLRGKGVEIIYLEGNHDFSMGDFFTAVIGARVYPDCGEITLDGRRVFLSHGDIIDKTFTYALWRGFLRSSVFKGLTKIFSPQFVWKAGQMLSKKSRVYTGGGTIDSKKASGIERHLKDFAKEKIRMGYDAVLLAHCHIPSIETLDIDGKKGIYANPGSFSMDMSHILYENGEFHLKNARGI